MRPRISVAQTAGGRGEQELISAVTVTRPTHQTTHVLESSDQRINIDPNEAVSVEVALSAGSGPVFLLAPNGGSINGGGGKLEIQTTKEDRNISFSFHPGTTRGGYTVEISDAHQTQTIEFWAGRESPRGAPGPHVTFTSR
jgi:hypothetical protein